MRMDQTEGFRPREVLRAVPGLPYRTLDSWTRTGLVEASARSAEGTGSIRRYSVADVLAIRVIRELRTAADGKRVSLQQLRKVVQRLREQEHKAMHPLASTRLLIVPGARPDVARVIITDDAAAELESLLREPGQRLLAAVIIPLAPLAAEVTQLLADVKAERGAMRERELESKREWNRRRARKRAAAKGAAA
jgi:DNA-binding transcriptional MerR regulator